MRGEGGEAAGRPGDRARCGHDRRTGGRRSMQGLPPGHTGSKDDRQSQGRASVLVRLGAADSLVGMLVTIGAGPIPVPGTVYVQFVVDGTNHPGTFERGRYDASGRGFHGSLHQFVEALAGSALPSFAFASPGENVTRSLSRPNAGDASARRPAPSSRVARKPNDAIIASTRMAWCRRAGHAPAASQVRKRRARSLAARS